MEGKNLYIDGKDRNFNLIRWVIEAADRDKNSRRLPSMKGLYCEAGDDGNARFACTDGQRLHILDMDSAGRNRATSAAWEIADYAKSNGGNALLSIEKITKSGILLGGEIDGEFPNYRKIIPATGAAEIGGLDFKDGFNEAVFTVFSTGRNLNLGHLSGLGLAGGEWTYHDTVRASKYPPVLFANKSLASVYLTAVFAPREAGAALAMAEKWKEAAKAREAAKAKKPEAAQFHKEMDPESPEAADFMKAVNALVSPEALKAAIEAEKAEEPEAEPEPRTSGEVAARKKRGSKKDYTREEKAAYHKAKADRMTEQYNRILASADNDMAKLQALLDALNIHSPCASYSFKNKVLVLANETLDARTFLQWKEAGRKVKKGAKAFDIFRPCKFKDGNSMDEDGNPVKEAVLFGAAPVFRYEDTEPADNRPYVYEPCREPFSRAA
jgi:hypothetical protein